MHGHSVHVWLSPRVAEQAEMPKCGVASGTWRPVANQAKMPPSGIACGRLLKPLRLKLQRGPRLRLRLVPGKLSRASKKPKTRCQAGLVTDPVDAQVYGTLRCHPATHRVGDNLTWRGFRDMPNNIAYSEEFQHEMQLRGYSEAAICRLTYVTPTFGEWQMGLPRGWTAADVPCKGAPPAPHGRIPSMALFSGCGGLELALRPFLRPVAYVEIWPAAQEVLKARIQDAWLDDAPVVADVRTVGKPMLTSLAESPQVLTFGFPCQDASAAGQQLGLDGERTRLFKEAARICKQLNPHVIFMENVNAIRGAVLQDLWHAVLLAFTRLGYTMHWLTISANHVGGQQCRLRWFCMGILEGADTSFLQQHALDLEGHTVGGGWNPPAPDVTEWLGVRHESDRLKMLGNIVIPKQGQTAWRLLAARAGR